MTPVSVASSGSLAHLASMSLAVSALVESVGWGGARRRGLARRSWPVEPVVAVVLAGARRRPRSGCQVRQVVGAGVVAAGAVVSDPASSLRPQALAVNASTPRHDNDKRSFLMHPPGNKMIGGAGDPIAGGGSLNCRPPQCNIFVDRIKKIRVGRH